MKVLEIRATAVVAAVYGYFLIFAEFSFVELVRAGGASLVQEKVVLGSMAVAGIASGFLAAWRGASPRMIRIALGVAATSSALAPYAKALPGVLGVAISTGCALGIATVSLAALAPAWCGVAWIGVGTGLGYACCNLPVVFMQSPTGQAWIGSGFAIVGLLATPSLSESPKRETKKIFPMWGALAIFTALVWMDSAAFFIIQHANDLKSGTWGDGLLWRNAAVHLAFAVVAGLWLKRGGARMIPAFSWAILAVASLAVNSESARSLAGWIYPAGVSLYSAALVAWPGWFSGVNGTRAAGWRAAWLFAIAGWFGSANGIGMAQSLQRVPPEFVAGAGVVLMGVMVLSDLHYWRSASVVGVVVLVAMLFPKSKTATTVDTVSRGRQVYLAEGCIHCHSQYVRPGSMDVVNWGPVKTVGEVLKEEPVLIGNRRQGPDLTNIGARRSETWLNLHFINPQAFAPSSTMPSYAHLFKSGKGDDLVHYLKESGVNKIATVVEQASRWTPLTAEKTANGKALFAKNCAVCHGSNGLGDGPMSSTLVRKPANLVAGPFAWTSPGNNLDLRVARVIKFGLPGTDMPGHEILTDRQIIALSDHVLKLRGHP